MESDSVKQITLKSLNGLKILSLDINFLETNLQRDFFDQIPNFEVYRNLSAYFSFTFYKLEQKLCIHKLKIDYSSSTSLIFNQIEKLSVKSKLLCASDNFRNILKLNINGCKIFIIDKNIFYGLANLRSLSLNNNQFQMIDSDAFSNLVQLVYLDLSSNNIDSIYKLRFVELVNLESLKLSDNQIRSLNENIFMNLKNLRELDLSSNRLEKLDPKLFIGLENLCELNLSNNKLTHFDLSILDNLPRLKKVNLSGNFINKDDETEILKRFKESTIESEFN